MCLYLYCIVNFKAQFSVCTLLIYGPCVGGSREYIAFHGFSSADVYVHCLAVLLNESAKISFTDE